MAAPQPAPQINPQTHKWNSMHKIKGSVKNMVLKGTDFPYRDAVDLANVLFDLHVALDQQPGTRLQGYPTGQVKDRHEELHKKLTAFIESVETGS